MTDAANLLIGVKTKGAAAAEKKLKRLEKQGKETSRSINKVGKSFSGLGAKIGLITGVAITATLVKSVKDVMDFTQAIADLSAITGATGKDLQFYADSAKEIGRTTSLSAQQAVEAFKLIGSAKPDLLSNAKALEEVTKQAVILAEAAGIQLPQAASALGSALNQFGLDSSKAGEVINALAASSKFGAAEIPAVTEALRNVGSAANALDVDLVETVAGIQALAIAGKQGADAGTSLRQVLLKLEKTADQKLMPSVNGLSGALKNLKGLNLTNSELMKLFGDEAFAAAVALLEQSDNVAKLNVNLRDTTTAIDQAKGRMDTLAGDVKELSSAFSGLTLEIGEALEPMLRLGAGALTDFINAINKAVFLPDGIDDLRAQMKLLNEELTAAEGVEYISDSFKQPVIAAITDRIKALHREIQKLTATEMKHDEQRKNIASSSGNIAEAITPRAVQDRASPHPDLMLPSKDFTNPDRITFIREMIEASEMLAESLRTPQEIFADEIEKLNELRDIRNERTNEGILSAENYSRAVTAAQGRLTDSIVEGNLTIDDSLTKTKDHFSQFEDAVGSWGASFAQEMIDGSGSFKNFANSMIKDMAKIALQQATQPIFNAIFKGLTGGSGGFVVGTGGGAGGVVPGLEGGGFTGNGARSGGVDGKGGFPAILHPQETVIDHAQGGSMGNVSVVVNVDASGTNTQGDGEGKDIGKAIGVAVRNVLIQEKRSGGLLA